MEIPKPDLKSSPDDSTIIRIRYKAVRDDLIDAISFFGTQALKDIWNAAEYLATIPRDSRDISKGVVISSTIRDDQYRAMVYQMSNMTLEEARSEVETIKQSAPHILDMYAILYKLSLEIRGISHRKFKHPVPEFSDYIRMVYSDVAKVVVSINQLPPDDILYQQFTYYGVLALSKLLPKTEIYKQMMFDYEDDSEPDEIIPEPEQPEPEPVVEDSEPQLQKPFSPSDPISPPSYPIDVPFVQKVNEAAAAPCDVDRNGNATGNTKKKDMYAMTPTSSPPLNDDDTYQQSHRSKPKTHRRK